MKKYIFYYRSLPYVLLQPPPTLVAASASLSIAPMLLRMQKFPRIMDTHSSIIVFISCFWVQLALLYYHFQVWSHESKAGSLWKKLWILLLWGLLFWCRVFCCSWCFGHVVCPWICSFLLLFWFPLSNQQDNSSSCKKQIEQGVHDGICRKFCWIEHFYRKSVFKILSFSPLI